MGQESILYYSIVGILGLLIFVCGAWLNSLLPSDCMDKELWSSVRFLIVAGAVVMTLSIGIYLCNLKCEGHGRRVNPYMMFLIGGLFIAIFAFFMIVLGKLKDARTSGGDKCLSDKKLKSLQTWLWVVGFVVLFIGLSSIGFAIYRIRKGPDNDDERRELLAIERKKASKARSSLRREQQRKREEEEIESLKQERISAKKREKKIKQERKSGKSGKSKSSRSRPIRRASSSRQGSWLKSGMYDDSVFSLSDDDDFDFSDMPLLERI